MSLAAAAATMTRATRFLGTGMSALPDAAPRLIEGIAREKVIGNGLRELDRFLSLLIDEVAAVQAPGLDHVALRRQRNTANKLRAVRTALRLPSPDHARLCAIGRMRNCLFHTAGWVRGDRPMAGWGPARAVAVGKRMSVSAAELAELCDFYDRLAADLIADGATRGAADQACATGVRLTCETVPV